jgi:hypothetical protein
MKKRSGKRKDRPATGRPFLQGKIVPTEANRQNSSGKSYEPKKEGVKEILINK